MNAVLYGWVRRGAVGSQTTCSQSHRPWTPGAGPLQLNCTGGFSSTQRPLWAPWKPSDPERSLTWKPLQTAWWVPAGTAPLPLVLPASVHMVRVRLTSPPPNGRGRCVIPAWHPPGHCNYFRHMTQMDQLEAILGFVMKEKHFF